MRKSNSMQCNSNGSLAVLFLTWHSNQRLRLNSSLWPVFVGRGDILVWPQNEFLDNILMSGPSWSFTFWVLNVTTLSVLCFPVTVVPASLSHGQKWVAYAHNDLWPLFSMSVFVPLLTKLPQDVPGKSPDCNRDLETVHCWSVSPYLSSTHWVKALINPFIIHPLMFSLQIKPHCNLFHKCLKVPLRVRIGQD